MKRRGAQWINRTLIQSPYCIGLCQSEKEFKKEMKRIKVPHRKRSEWLSPGKDGQVHFFKNGRNLFCIVCLTNEHKPKKTHMIGLLIHEAVHIWHYIKKDMNERKPGQEFEAYSIQHIAQGLIAVYKGEVNP